MRIALEQGIYQFNLESEPEAEMLSEVALSMGRKAPVAYRINPDVDAGTHAKISTGRSENKFGIPYDRALASYAAARDLPGLDVRSDEHTSELQSLMRISYAVFCLQKKKTTK